MEGEAVDYPLVCRVVVPCLRVPRHSLYSYYYTSIIHIKHLYTRVPDEERDVTHTEPTIVANQITMHRREVFLLENDLIHRHKIDSVKDKYYFSFDPTHLNTITDVLSDWICPDLIPIIMGIVLMGL